MYNNNLLIFDLFLHYYNNQYLLIMGYVLLIWVLFFLFIGIGLHLYFPMIIGVIGGLILYYLDDERL